MIFSPVGSPAQGDFVESDREYQDNVELQFGTSSDVQIRWDTGQTNDALLFGLSGSNNVIFCPVADMGTNYGHSNSTDPTLYIQSADQTSTADWVRVFHDQTDGRVQAGIGTLAIGAPSGVNVQWAGTLVAGTFPLNVGGTATLGAAGSGTLYSAIDVPAHTITISGTTQVTSRGFAGVSIGQVTVTNADTNTVDNAASLYIAGPVAQAGTCTITNKYSLWVDSGVSRFDGDTKHGGNKVDLSIANDAGEYIYSSADGYFDIYAGETRCFVSSASLNYSFVSMRFSDNIYSAWGNSEDAQMSWQTDATYEDRLVLGIGTATNIFVICETADVAFEHQHSAQTNPTLYIHSANQSTTEWVGITHDQTNALFTAGEGGFSFVQSVNDGATPTAFTLTAGAHTDCLTTAEVTDVLIDLSRTINWAQGNITNQRSVRILSPTLSFDTSASVVTNAVTMSIDGCPTSNVTNSRFNNAIALQVGGSKTIGPAVAALKYRAIDIPAHTMTLSGSTALTGSPGIAGLSIGQITATNEDALTINNAASLYIAGAPVGAGSGPATITNAYSIWIDAGIMRYDSTAANDGATDQCTLGLTGNNGPTTAAQSIWQKINMNGTDYWIAAWV